jgi:hypothetical protein
MQGIVDHRKSLPPPITPHRGAKHRYRWLPRVVALRIGPETDQPAERALGVTRSGIDEDAGGPIGAFGVRVDPLLQCR